MLTTRLRFEHRRTGEPALGLGTDRPRLSWVNADAPDGFVQAAAEVELTRTPWGGASVTRTVALAGPDQVLVAWPDEPLASRERVVVRVRAIGDDSAVADWSDPAVAEAGLLATADWGDARFVSPAEIGAQDAPAPALLSSLEVPGGVRSARLHITAHGWYEVLVNGVKVGADWFGPGWTVYPKRLRYYSYDVTDLLTPGRNDLAILLGDGWFRSPLTWELRRNFYGDRLAALARLEVVTDDGSHLVLATDGTWRAVETHIIANSLYGGEHQDLRRPLLGTDLSPVEPIDASLDRLVAAEGPAVREVARVVAQRVWRSPAGKLLVDFGQNLVGLTRLTVRGLMAGHRVTVRHAEVLEHDELGTRPLRKATATDTYVLGGPDEQVLQAHFTFHGFRYAEVDGLDDLAAADIEAVVLSSDVVRTGWFESSDDLLNRLHDNVFWGMRGNFVDVPTDCPQRDERLGWTGDLQVFSPTALFLADVAGFLSSWSADLAAEQKPDGNVPIVIPNALDGQSRMGDMVSAAWGDAAVIVPWNVYRATGDLDLLRRQLPSMKAWVDRVDQAAGEDHLWTGGFQFGDWLDPDAPPDSPAAAKADSDLVATCCFCHSADLTARACEAVGDTAGAARYATLADAVRAAFQHRYVTPDGLIFGDAPTSYAQAIVWHILTPEQAVNAGDRLADLVRLASFRISTGFVGTPIITDALSSTGHADVAYRLLQERACPSWLYPVTMGATTIWERWDSMLPDGTINPGEMTSFNHYALGGVADWMHRVVGGLGFDPVTRSVTVAPVPGGTLTHASARLDTPYGPAASAWRRDGGQVIVQAVVPAGLVGHVVLPDGTTREVASGTHTFTVTPQARDERPATIRDLIGSPYWTAVSAAVVAKTPFHDDRALAKALAKALDAPVGLVAMAATLGGTAGPLGELTAEIDAILAA